MSIVADIKEVADLVKKIGDLDLYRKIIELEGAVIELTRENRDLDQKNTEMKATLSFSKKLTFEKPFWYADGDEAPFCPRCWEVQGAAVHLVGPSTGYRLYQCPECRREYNSKGGYVAYR